MSATVESGPTAVAGSATSDNRLRHFLVGKDSGLPAGVLVWAAAALMVASGLIHLHLWDIAYRHVATLGPLFLVQTVACLVIAVLLAATRRGVLLVAGTGLMAGTIVGFILVTTVGLFGFTLTTITSWAVWALITEAGALALLATAATRQFSKL
jgi:hypothetical protein